jgi:acyl dehydratase
VRTMAVRFVSPAFPGDTIRIELFEGQESIQFRAWAKERKTLVLDRGRCTLSD